MLQRSLNFAASGIVVMDESVYVFEQSGGGEGEFGGIRAGARENEAFAQMLDGASAVRLVVQAELVRGGGGEVEVEMAGRGVEGAGLDVWAYAAHRGGGEEEEG